MHLKLFRSSEIPADLNLFQNAEYDETAFAETFAVLAEHGNSYEIVEPSEAERDELVRAAWAWAVKTSTKVTHVFGTNSDKWQGIATYVPALYVYHESDDDPVGIYPHHVGDGYATIAAFLRSQRLGLAT